MFRRVLIWLALSLAVALMSVAEPVSAAPRLHRIVAVGDLHGDFSAWRDIARAAQLIDADGRWSGGRTVLVQVGDVIDRGPRSLDIIHDLMRLQGEAGAAGGRVIAMVGNHEAMNVTGDLRYVSAGDYAAFVTPQSAQVRDDLYTANKGRIEDAYRKQDATMTSKAILLAWLSTVPLGQIEHQRAWRPDGPIGQWVIANPAVVKLDDSLFVHGGVSAAYAGLSLKQINRRVAAALKSDDIAPEAIINDPSGPLWYRGYVMPFAGSPAPAADDDDARTTTAPHDKLAISPGDELDRVLKAYGVLRMVIGHTPILSGIATTYDSELIRIDTGISAFYGGKLSYLEIIDGEPVPHEVERSLRSH